MPGVAGRARAASSTTAPTGRLTANSQGQPATERIAAPIVGPAAEDSATTSAFRPMAVPSRLSG